MSSRLLRSTAAAALIAATSFAAACSGSNPIAPQAPTVSAPAASTSVQTTTVRRAASIAGDVTPIYIAGGKGSNYVCSELATLYGGTDAEWLGPESLKLDSAPTAGSYTLSDGYVTVSISNGTATSFTWSSNVAIDAVFVKSGQGHNLYVYDEATGGTGLTTPFVDNKYQDISHINFCYDINLAVTKSAATTFTRDYDWTIAKTVDQPQVAILDNATKTVNYAVAVTKDAGTDSNWAVSGTITVTNPHNTLVANGVSVADALSDHGAIAVDCGGVTTLGPGMSMTCSYASAVASGASRINTAKADSSTYGVVAGIGTAAVDFINPTNVLDNAVSVSDTVAGPLSSALASSHTFSYARTINGADYACGSTSTLGNTASLSTDDGATESASANVTVTKTCTPPPPPPAATGCTLTQGYWGTHIASHTKYDLTWKLIGPNAENTAFYLSGRTYLQQLRTSAGGNAYNILANQFIAARLNILKGAAAPAGVDLAAIETFFRTYTPAQIGALKGGAALRTQALSWAAMLDSYNNGLLNVPHCG